MSLSPVMITTWKFGLPACREGWRRLSTGSSALDAIELAANVTEEDSSASSVGYGGLPNSEGIVELDAAIMDGWTHSAGAVAGLTGIMHPISVARRVMERTPHVMLVGDNARRFALSQGFTIIDLLTESSRARWEQWRAEHSASDVAHFEEGKWEEGRGKSGVADQSKIQNPKSKIEGHDTIGLCALDREGNLAVGCTTSGLAWKLPGRVGDSPLIGSGLYVDNEIGGAAATGNGDEIMKVCLSYRVVMLMEQGRSAQEACEEALRYLLRKRPPELHNNYGAAVIAMRRDGSYGSAGTFSGFRDPDRLWQCALASDQIPNGELFEGPYVGLDEAYSKLANIPSASAP